uniref:DUF1269 domain-containing protein n=1 Tax=Cohnella candidum TaxID=2674991 RepID=A0A3G3K5S5_9BACL|nr:hypothetical protein EAV92_06750 [Cohnella candidum]
MQIFAAFDHNIFLELAISKLKENDIRDIYAVPLDKRKKDMKMFDNIHQSDGISLIDIGMIFAFLGGTIGAARGFAMDWGPINWGLIGAGSGFLVGFAIDLIINLVKRKKLRVSKNRGPEVILIVTCTKDQAKQVERIMWDHLARGLAATQTSVGTVQEGT